VTPKLWFLVVLVGIVVLIWLGQRFGRGTSRPLAARFVATRPNARAIGTEAIDIDAFTGDMKRNAALGERPVTDTWDRDGLQTHVAPVKDDATYAARFHAAHGRKDQKQ
jgi:hypothetical protein